jgi:1,4-dihydroxy-6-naphthoate synthase
MKLRVGLSPCPNDTFLFHAMLHGIVATPGVEWEPVMEDVESLNERMARGDLEVTKASFAAFAYSRDRYAALRTGGALGRGNGPLVVSRAPLAADSLAGVRVLLPGKLTTAALLFHTFHPECRDTPSVRYDEIVPALLRGEADAGVVIHEVRFTYRERGLHFVEDLGISLEQTTQLPVPLGGVFVRRDVPTNVAANIERWLGASVAAARANPAASRDYVRAHAQELSEGVTSAHIALYVNEFSEGYGPEGERAIEQLLRMAEQAGGVARSALPTFVSPRAPG